MVKVDRKNADAKAPAEKDNGLFVTIFTDGSYCPNTTAFNAYANKLKAAGVKFVKAKHVKAHTNNATNRTHINRIVDRLAGIEMRKHRRLNHGS